MEREPDYIKVSDAAERLSLNKMTIYRRFHDGTIEGYQNEKTRSIYIKNPFKKQEENDVKGKVALYIRVSKNDEKEIEEQLKTLREYAFSKNYVISEEIIEIAYVFEKRPKLLDLLKRNNTYEKIIVLNKTTISAFDFEYIDTYIDSYFKEIEVVNSAINLKENIVTDIIEFLKK